MVALRHKYGYLNIFGPHHKSVTTKTGIQSEYNSTDHLFTQFSSTPALQKTYRETNICPMILKNKGKKKEEGL